MQLDTSGISQRVSAHAPQNTSFNIQFSVLTVFTAFTAAHLETVSCHGWSQNITSNCNASSVINDNAHYRPTTTGTCQSAATCGSYLARALTYDKATGCSQQSHTTITTMHTKGAVFHPCQLWGLYSWHLASKSSLAFAPFHFNPFLLGTGQHPGGSYGSTLCFLRAHFVQYGQHDSLRYLLA